MVLSAMNIMIFEIDFHVVTIYFSVIDKSHLIKFSAALGSIHNT